MNIQSACLQDFRRSQKIVVSAIVATCTFGVTASAQAASPAASACPPQYFLSSNLAQNAGFDDPEASIPLGTSTCWHNGDPGAPVSAAAGWTMHSSNDGDTVCSRLVASNAPGAAGTNMLRFTAFGNEGGVFQSLTLPEDKSYMFSIWVFVRKGQVAIQSNAFTGGPVAWTSKHDEWEQIRVCTNSEFSTNAMVIYNQDPNGGVFFMDRAELYEISTLE